MAAGAVSLKTSYDMIILSFCNIVKSQSKCASASNSLGSFIRLIDDVLQYEFIRTFQYDVMTGIYIVSKLC